MTFTQAGIILNTRNYHACRDFSGAVLGLEMLHQVGTGDDDITVFALGDTYLMVESGGTAHPSRKPSELCPTKFRFNVPDIEAAARELADKGVRIDVLWHDWGTTAEFADPDGNRCALRSDAGFAG